MNTQTPQVRPRLGSSNKTPIVKGGLDRPRPHSTPPRDDSGDYFVIIDGKKQRLMRVSNMPPNGDSRQLAAWKERQLFVGQRVAETFQPSLIQRLRAATALNEVPSDELDQLAEAFRELSGSNAARDLGTTLHTWTEFADIERYMKGRDDDDILADVDAEWRAHIQAYWEALDRHDLVVEHIEVRVCNVDERYGGTVDRFLRHTPTWQLFLGDLKTRSKSMIWPSICGQLGCYALHTHAVNPDTYEAEPRIEHNTDHVLVIHLPAVLDEGVEPWAKVLEIPYRVAVDAAEAQWMQRSLGNVVKRKGFAPEFQGHNVAPAEPVEVLEPVNESPEAVEPDPEPEPELLPTVDQTETEAAEAIVANLDPAAVAVDAADLPITDGLWAWLWARIAQVKANGDAVGVLAAEFNLREIPRITDREHSPLANRWFDDLNAAIDNAERHGELPFIPRPKIDGATMRTVTEANDILKGLPVDLRNDPALKTLVGTRTIKETMGNPSDAASLLACLANLDDERVNRIQELSELQMRGLLPWVETWAKAITPNSRQDAPTDEERLAIGHLALSYDNGVLDDQGNLVDFDDVLEQVGGRAALKKAVNAAQQIWPLHITTCGKADDLQNYPQTVALALRVHLESEQLRSA